MPRLVNISPSYRRHRPSGRALVCIDGQRIYLGKWNTGESRKRYHQLIAEWLANGRRLPTNESTADPTVAELIVPYWRHSKSYYRRNRQPTSELGLIKSPTGEKVEISGTVRWTTEQFPGRDPQPGFGMYIEPMTDSYTDFYQNLLLN